MQTSAILRRPITYFAWNMRSSWLPLIASSAGHRLTRRRLMDILTDQYEGVVAYHGCRPVDIDSYRLGGLRRSETARLDKRAREIFSQERFPELSADEVGKAIAELGRRDDGRIFACLDYDFYMTYCTHYALYGSERLIAIAAILSRNGVQDYRQELKKYGRPAVLHVHLPWWCMGESTLSEFVNHVSKSIRKIKELKRLSRVDFGFEFYDALPPSSIIKIEHPDRLPDPFESDFP